MPITKPISILDPERFDLSVLSPAETLWLWRHRQKSPTGRLLGRTGQSMNQAEAAEALGISKKDYIRLETGEAARLTVEELQSLQKLLHHLTPLDPVPSPAELCLLARRRSGMNLPEVAEDTLGVSRVTYLNWERNGREEIVTYWEELGYRFPRVPLKRAS